MQAVTKYIFKYIKHDIDEISTKIQYKRCQYEQLKKM